MSLLAALADLVLPRRCAGCGGPSGALCPSCLPLPPAFAAGSGAWAAGWYDGALRTAVLAYKERGRRDLAAPLGGLLGSAVRAALAAERSPPARALLVPIPSSRAAAAARGGDHVRRLARHAAPVCGFRVAPDALRLTRAVLDSAGLTVAERSTNLVGAMTAARAPSGLAAVVVDDIMTTGATLREGVRALSAAGWPVIGSAVVAATPKRFGGGSRGPLAEHSDTV